MLLVCKHPRTGVTHATSRGKLYCGRVVEVGPARHEDDERPLVFIAPESAVTCKVCRMALEREG